MTSYYKPKEGYVHNPLLKYPRNSTCFCGSEKKFKKCHLRSLSGTVSKDDEKELKDYMERINLKCR